MKTFYIALAAIAVVGVAAIVYAARGGGGSMATETVEFDTALTAQELTQRARGVSLGNENAPVDLRVFSDFQCPGCAAWSGRIEPLLKREFIETGKVRLTYYDYPIESSHRYAFITARAARCAEDQGRFWEYHDRLFATQNQWAYSQTMPTELLENIARELGLNVSDFNACLRSDRHADLVTANKLLGEALRIGGTPTVFINSKPLNNWNSYEDVKQAIHAAGGA